MAGPLRHSLLLVVIVCTAFFTTEAFHSVNLPSQFPRRYKLCAAKPSSSSSSMDDVGTTAASEQNTPDDKEDNKAMTFLRKIGKVGGVANKDYRFAMGVDEGPSGKAAGHGGMKNLKKAKSSYKSCVETGVVDDMTEVFPTASCGTEWQGYTDRVMGGVSSGSLAREIFEGRTANVLRGSVSLENNGGFIQMATNLFLPQKSNAVDASDYDGVELEVHCQGDGEHDHETFNVHLKTQACTRPFSSYRASFEIPTGTWQQVRIPWSAFQAKGPGAVDTSFDISMLTRVGIVAIGKEMNHVIVALSSFRFYTNAQDNDAGNPFQA